MISKEEIKQGSVMKHHNSGRASGLALVLILIVALVVAWLAVTQLGFLRRTEESLSGTQSTDVVQQARDAVDALNDRMEEMAGQP